MKRVSRAARAHLIRITRRAVLRQAMASQHYQELERLGGPRYWDRRGEPMSFSEWVLAVEDGADARRVLETTLPNGLWVSTVWLGMNHRYGPGKPLIFESMVFVSSQRLLELDQRRYTSELAARTGHLELVREWSAKEAPKGGWDEA